VDRSTENPGKLRKGDGLGHICASGNRYEEAAEDGLGAAHRGSILGCDGSNRYIASL